MRLSPPSALLTLALLAGCGGGSSQPSGNPGPPPSLKEEIVSLARNYYLWHDTIPANVQPEAHREPEDLLNHLTSVARVLGRDRFWSFLQKKDGPSGTLLYDPHAGQEVQFGFKALVQAGHCRIAYVLSGSSAAQAGMARGDEILALAPTRAGLDDPGNRVLVLLASGRLELALGPEVPGMTRYFRIRKGGTGLPADVAVTMAMSSLDLVPDADRPVLIDAGAGHRVGYLQLRAFKSPAEDLLRTACGHLRRQGATDLIVDLRYNHGGLRDTACVFANLLRAGQGPNDVMFRIHFNPLRPAGETVHFRPEANALSPGRIAFIVTGESASCSEALVNALLPYYPRQNIALVGSRTYGKPVGMECLPLRAAGWELYLVSMHIRNAHGVGDYFRGLPDAGYIGSSCAAEDDFRHALGDPAEASTAAALHWIVTGAAPHGPIQAPFPVAVAEHQAPEGRPLLGRDPDLPGLF